VPNAIPLYFVILSFRAHAVEGPAVYDEKSRFLMVKAIRNDKLDGNCRSLDLMSFAERSSYGARDDKLKCGRFKIEPRSGTRMQPTAQAVGSLAK